MREIKYLYDNFEILYLSATTVITYIVKFVRILPTDNFESIGYENATNIL